MVLMKNKKFIDVCSDSENRIQLLNQSCIENRIRLEKLCQQIERCQDMMIIECVNDYLSHFKNCQIEN
jgi:hypothetical protein